MHTTHQRMLDQIKIYLPNIKMSEYLAMLKAAISNTEYNDIYPSKKALVTISQTVTPTELNFDYVIIENVWATGVSDLNDFPLATDKEYYKYEANGDEIIFKDTGNYVIEYRYRPTITDENSDPMIPEAYIQSIIENIIYQAMLQIDVNKAMVYLQNSILHSKQAHHKEVRKQRRTFLKPLF